MRLREGWLPGALNEGHADEKPRKAGCQTQEEGLLSRATGLRATRRLRGTGWDGRNPGRSPGLPA